MHLLAAKPGGIADGTEAVDLGQTPGEIVLLSAADTELACFAAAQARLGPDAPSLRLANLLNLSHNLSVDSYMDAVVQHARIVVVRLLGGESYWPYGVERLEATCRARQIPLALLPGDERPDAALAACGTVAHDSADRLWRYCSHGGLDNATQCLRYAASLIGRPAVWSEPTPLARAGLYWPEAAGHGLAFEDLTARWRAQAPIAALVFYRALVQAANTAPIDALIAALQAEGLNPLPVFVTSLKDPPAAKLLETLLQAAGPAVILNGTGFAVSSPSAARPTPFERSGAPVLQVVFAGCTEQDWAAGTRGLGPRDIAMNVALPEVDGRILSRAVSFKTETRFDPATESGIVGYAPRPDRIAFVAALAARWARLARTPAAERRIALVLANYPNRDGRIGNGVGLDTPAGTVTLLQAMAEAGYDVADAPTSGAALMAALTAGPTNERRGRTERQDGERLSLDAYRRFFHTLPAATRARVSERWGPPEDDPFYEPNAEGFVLAARRYGNIVLAVQPARGYNIDPQSSYHDPDLPPPHGYFAFYAWLRESFDTHAVLHMGKHGNLEWLPGKALALSAECFPEATLGPLPHIYPFIVNDPGEGSQAKRRAAAVIVDHLTPPLTRAESYGVLRQLEILVDEYFEAASLDPRRCAVLRDEIIELARGNGIDEDCGMAATDGSDAALQKLDGYLCELKELQIRDGLHVFGVSPEGDQRIDLLVALARTPRGAALGEQSLTRALAQDLGLDIDPLDAAMAKPWQGPRPACLVDLTDGETPVWRSHGDTVERLEGLARALVAGERRAAPAWRDTRAVLAAIEAQIAPAVVACGGREIAGALAALAGRFVPPGPSGAPSRGRTDVLPTGRNFFSIDTRTVPTPAAWRLGWASAGLLVEHYAQSHGNWPRTMAISAWGTSNMRTGGDDIAQALALMGVQPRWEPASGRVIDFEILPVSVLDRPRVDVTLRVSGFFRDAFPALIDLFDSAVQAVAALDEDEADNPLAAQVKRESESFAGDAGTPQEAARRAAYRVFGAKPGAYGAGLQALIDEGGWQTERDLADAYVAWGGYAYGAGAEGHAAHALFERRLGAIEAVVHNQDNREHDLLDSDDYYQFEGGLTAAVRELSGRQPTVYHNDHARPESPKIRTLEDEIARTVRARVVNPKWIRGVMRHGYKGAFEMAATVDYLFAFAATSHAVRDHHFDAVFDAYLGDPEVRKFIEEANPAALREMAARLREAQVRGLWKPRSNHAWELLGSLAQGTAPEPVQ